MRGSLYCRLVGLLLVLFFASCKQNNSGNSEMIALLKSIDDTETDIKNQFCPEARLVFYDSVLQNTSDYNRKFISGFYKSAALLQLGEEGQAIDAYTRLLAIMNPADKLNAIMIKKEMAVAYLRLGERNNCINNHGTQSCVFPLTGNGIHTDKTGSMRAIDIYQTILKENPKDLESRWLLNIAYMTVQGYPEKVPAEYLIPNLGVDSSLNLIKPFLDVAVNVGLNAKNMAGGSIVDDFNNDGYMDIITSSWGLKEGMHYCQNNGDGKFTNISQPSGLGQLTGGLNIMQTDYNNDGLKDVFVLRGAWKGEFGREPNSLLRNNGDGTFTDVTKESGLLTFHPTQTATWNDFNNDGWLDVFIGNESVDPSDGHRCELYINNQDGTFKETAVVSGAAITAFVKGVTSGDYDNDGLVDVFLSTVSGGKTLLRNRGSKDGVVHFEDVTQRSGLGVCNGRTFPTWFWDYDNDGWLDLLVCSYDFDKSLAYYAAAEALGMPLGNSAKQWLFHNKKDGTFEEVTDKAGLNKVAFAMGSNFGDVDNDGYSDIYLGTGNPLYSSIVPNKMFLNRGGASFADVTNAARVGNLQKGHGVSFSDLDNDGDVDVYMDMGGAFTGDAYQNSLYLNPGQNNNHWINITLEGTQSNRAAIGTKIKVTFRENGQLRSVYKDVNSGGSFGSNPLTQHFGIGQATTVESIEIKWMVSGKVQTFRDIRPERHIHIKEGDKEYTTKALNIVDFTAQGLGVIGCSPK